MSYFHRALRTALMTGIVMTMCVVGASAANVGVGTVNGDGLRLREEANTSASILGRAYTGDKVTVELSVYDLNRGRITYRFK